MGSNVPIPTGYHFKPSPKELIKSYLRRRLLNQPLPCRVIKELNIYDLHPKDILGNTPAGKHLYFFTPRKKKYPNGTRPARGTNGGYWKASGRNIIIRDKNKKEIGRKKFLVFHEGHQRDGKKTSWLMHEYTIKEFWYPTDQNNEELGAMALCEIYLKRTSNRSRDGELQVDEEEEEEEGSVSHSPDNSNIEDNIIADRLVQPHPAQYNHGNDRGKALIASTKEFPLGSPSAFSPITARPRPSMPFIGYDNIQRHNMVLVAQSSLRSSGPLQLEAPYLYNRTTMPISNPEQLDSFVHSFYRPCMVSKPSSLQFGNSISSSSRNQLMLPPQHMPHGGMPSPSPSPSPEFGVATASSSQYQMPPRRMPAPPFCFEALQLMPSASEASPQTTLWPLPRHLS